MNNLDLQYQNLLQDILLEGNEKTDRTGTGTISVFGKQIRHKMSEGFPLLTTKKMAIKSIMTELKREIEHPRQDQFVKQMPSLRWSQ